MTHDDIEKILNNPPLKRTVTLQKLIKFIHENPKDFFTRDAEKIERLKQFILLCMKIINNPYKQKRLIGCVAFCIALHNAKLETTLSQELIEILFQNCTDNIYFEKSIPIFANYGLLKTLAIIENKLNATSAIKKNTFNNALQNPILCIFSRALPSAYQNDDLVKKSFNLNNIAKITSETHINNFKTIFNHHKDKVDFSTFTKDELIFLDFVCSVYFSSPADLSVAINILKDENLYKPESFYNTLYHHNELQIDTRRYIMATALKYKANKELFDEMMRFDNKWLTDFIITSDDPKLNKLLEESRISLTESSEPEEPFSPCKEFLV